MISSPFHLQLLRLDSRSILFSFTTCHSRMTTETFVAKYSNDPPRGREVQRTSLSSFPSLLLLNKLSSLIKIFRPTPGVLRLPGLTVATCRSSKNSGRLIPDNCYHGHGLCGARLQIIATSCLHPYTIVTVKILSQRVPYCLYLSTFASCKPFPHATAFTEAWRDIQSYLLLLLEAGKFMAGLCSSFEKYCFFQSS